MTWRNVFILFCLFCTVCEAEDIGISVNQASFNVLPGEPINFILSVTNLSPGDLQIAGDDLSHAVQVKSVLIGPDGQPRDCYSDSSAPASPQPGKRFLLGKNQTLSLPSWISRHTSCALTSLPTGIYRGEISLSLYVLGSERFRECTASTSVSVKIVQPTGEDLAYLRDLEHAIASRDPSDSRGGTLQQHPLEWGEVLHTYRAKAEALCLLKYPTSTYAAYVVHESMRRFINSNWQMVANDVTNQIGNRSLPDDTGLSKDGWQYLDFDQEMKWWDKWIGIILKNHPDIWFADELKLKRAVNLVRQNKYAAGTADLQVLARDAKEPVAGAAKEFLEIMKEKGWIQAESAATAPPPAPPPEKSVQAPTAKPPGGGS